MALLPIWLNSDRANPMPVVGYAKGARSLSVMAGLVPAIHALLAA